MGIHIDLVKDESITISKKEYFKMLAFKMDILISNRYFPESREKIETEIIRLEDEMSKLVN